MNTEHPFAPNDVRRPIDLRLIPIMLTFFAMGFADLVGIVVNYLQADFDLSDTGANFFASMLFFWFLIGAIPSAMLMNKIGRKKTVLVSLCLTFSTGLLPLFGDGLWPMGLALAFLGIGNTIMQVSINPLISNIVPKRKLAGVMTFGFFIKAIAALSAPLIAAWCALTFSDWRLVFAVFSAEALIAFGALAVVRIRPEEVTGHFSNWRENFALLARPIILLSFFGVLCHVGLDVGMNVTIPKILMSRLGLPIEEASFGISIYFLFRMIGSLLGAYVLSRFSVRGIYFGSVCLILAGLGGLSLFNTRAILYMSPAFIGLGNANIFSIIVAQAMLSLPDKKNEVSGLMITAVCGGAVVVPLMGVVSDTFGSLNAALGLAGLCALYLLYLTNKVTGKNT